MSKDEDKDEDLKIFLEDPRGQGLSSRTTTLAAVRQYGEIDMNLNLTGVQWQISHPFVTKSLQDDGAWYFACYVSVLNPRKFSRTWTSENEDKDKDLKIGPQGSSRTRTFLEDNNTDSYSLKQTNASHQCPLVRSKYKISEVSPNGTRKTYGFVKQMGLEWKAEGVTGG